VNLSSVLLGAGAPDAAALVGARGVTSYSAVADLVERLAGVLVRDGVQAGDRVVVTSENREEFVVAYLAVLRVGAICVPLNPLAPAAELEREITELEATLALGCGPSASMLGAAVAKVVTVDLDALPEERAPIVERAGDDIAVRAAEPDLLDALHAL
jgi:acyl-coenzyme A synthetase/AMP-(fatty) acid ligase